MKNTLPKHTTLNISFSRCTIFGMFLILHLYILTSHHTEVQTENTAFDLSDDKKDQILHELEVIEEENIEKSPSPTTFDKFPVEAIDPRRSSDNERLYYYPGRVWLDSDGNPIHAHGGGILYDDISSTYYWYGEYKDGVTYRSPKGVDRVDVIGVACYSSKDLWTWKNEGIVLSAQTENSTHDLHKSKVLERPKVIYNHMTGKYVMWMHIDDAMYSKASVGVAVSDSPTGPFSYLYSMKPHGCDSRDMTIFKDDDGVAYLIYSSRGNSEIHIGNLTSDYLDVTPVMMSHLVGLYREAPAVFKHNGTYYMITSGCTGWAPNEASFHVAASMMGPWETIGNPCICGNKELQSTTFLSQSTFVLPLRGVSSDWFVFMADRWKHSNLSESRYVWLPLKVGGDQLLNFRFGAKVSIYWHGRWKLLVN